MAASYHHSRTTYTVLSLFVVAVIVLAFVNEPLLVSRVQTVSLGIQSFKKKKGKFQHPGDRAIIIGDTHGMNRSLHNLLSTLSYDPHKDTLFLAGDILAKSSEAGSLAILDFLSQRRNGECFPEIQPRRPEKGLASGARKSSECKQVFAVRGNHDQMIVQWRAWRDWFEPLQLTFPSASLYPRRFSVPSLPSITSTQSATYDAGPPVGTGSQFLDIIESEWLRDRTADPSGAASDPQEWADTARKRAAGTWRAEWWKRIPQPGRGRAAKDWIMFSDHYWIARDMSTEQAEFLYSLPLIIHIPSEHFFLAHAGLLPLDPRRPATDERQPLAHLPSPDDVIDIGDADYDHALLRMDAPQGPLQEPDLHGNHTEGDIEELRIAQERSILHDVPHNRDPWVVLNMRGVRKSGKVTRRSDKGTPWAKIWNGQMKRCAGFKNATALDSDTTQEDEWEEDTASRASHVSISCQVRENDGEEDEKPLPCYPSTVVYGHAASRDLDVRRWTVGLDTGCLYGRRLTSLVLQRKSGTEGRSRTLPTDDEDEDDDEEEEESSEEEEDELDEYATSDGPTRLGAVNARFARVAGGSAVARSRARQRKTWTRSIKFGDKASDLQAKLVSIKCPKAGDFAGP
ncbi:hypothetical protein BN946_scf184945.g37 [Trametes cinnabarina]|uniref:Calcineurin-like phosphoesterase domain-containing protein n=1 Tax=Pycnoporus cinnabarinus TaxID=5643 RepID=A0A060SKQ4_PYCCI|nr:hypothetical protein BN946_scf184945.g37 [Trametes cinnabarina]